MTDEFRAMDKLQFDVEQGVDDVLGGRGVAPFEEMCDPDTPGCHPAKMGIETDDLDLRPAGVAEPEEQNIGLLDDLVDSAADGLGDTGVERELGTTDRMTVLGEVDDLISDDLEGF